MFWTSALLAQGVAATLAWALLPGGFPIVHARFFANRALPALLVVSLLLVAVQALRRSRSVSALLLLYPSVWLGLALAAGIAFPQSGGRVALGAAFVALLLALGLAGNWWRNGVPSPGAWLAAVPAAALGAAFVLAQRAPDPSTRPFAATLGSDAASERERVAIDAVEPIELAPWLRVAPSSGRVVVQSDAVSIVVEPGLEFISRSPDRFWTVFAPARPAPPPALVRVERTDREVHARSADRGRLTVQAMPVGTAAIEALTWVEAPVYSHLNSFARLSVTGHRRLGLRFSPCPDLAVEVVHSEYPFGAPARLAYLDARGIFRVVQASDAEKGPFTTLAEGPLARGEPLGIVLLEIGDASRRELATIVFRDWSLQLSTELSPTAGWGLPQNAVEFGRASSEPTSAAYIDLTLAGTSVGRGWDSVGHRAGVYRNRIEIRLPPSGS
jgi:hypothetical protein